jgi:hypothetical protein
MDMTNVPALCKRRAFPNFLATLFTSSREHLSPVGGEPLFEDRRHPQNKSPEKVRSAEPKVAFIIKGEQCACVSRQEVGRQATLRGRQKTKKSSRPFFYNMGVRVQSAWCGVLMNAVC